MLIAGKGNGAEDWLQVLDPADPAHEAPGDDLPFGGELGRSDAAVLPSVARFTRVCAYDRPDIRVGDDVTTPRPQPHAVDDDVSDLHALLGALGEPGPVVLVAHSYGGLIATLYARAHPDVVGGLVREAEQRGVQLGQLPADVLKAAHGSLSGDGLKGALDPAAAVERRSLVGGPARATVEVAIAAARQRWAD